MEEREKIQAAQLIHEKARYYRGRFLNSVACIEHDIAHLLTDYFCTSDPGKRKIFYEDIATGSFFNLNRKKGILIRIVQADYPHYWEENQEVLSAFQKVIELRNKLAHSIVDVSEEALARPIKEGIGFTDLDDGRPITEQEFNDWDIKANMIHSCLRDIKRLLPFKQIKPDPTC
ncbi:MAG: hypothetical protein NTW64_01825 [Candidatus Omnitrophica bacterium]|nr:hypothetical protein [Candidatus Omnitrophota bacterium]